jgi:hypothetical protein
MYVDGSGISNVRTHSLRNTTSGLTGATAVAVYITIEGCITFFSSTPTARVAFAVALSTIGPSPYFFSVKKARKPSTSSPIHFSFVVVVNGSNTQNTIWNILEAEEESDAIYIYITFHIISNRRATTMNSKRSH